MTTRPTISPLFATNATLGTGVESALVPRLDPGAGIRARGLLGNTRAPGRWFNFLLGLAGDWIAYLDQKSGHEYNILNYGADPTGATDSAAAYASAVAAAVAAGGGVVWMPGAFRFDSGLSLPNGVSLLGIPGITNLFLNHATADFITAVNGSSNGANPQLIAGINFEGLIDASGRVLFDGGANQRNWRIQDCSVNGGLSHLKGFFFRCDGNASSKFVIDNVTGVIPTGGSSFVSFVNGGDLTIRGGKVSVPAAWSGGAITTVNDVKVRISGVRLDGSAFSSGGGSLVSVGASSFVRIDGCIFDAGGGSNITPISLSGGAHLNMAPDNQFIACLPLDTGTAIAALGSNVQLLPLARYDAGASGSKTLEGGYASYFVSATANTAIRLPAGRYPGQPLQLTFFNADAAARNMTFAVTPVTGTTIPNPVTPGDTLTGIFAWEDRDGSGSYRWIQQGTWGGGLTLV
jgi:Pectate lyase superfamily protein